MNLKVQRDCHQIKKILIPLMKWMREDMRLCVVHFDTMLDEYQVLQRDVDIQQNDDIPNENTFASGEGQMPLSVFQDEHTEYLTFSTFFVANHVQKHRRSNTCSLQ